MPGDLGVCGGWPVVGIENNNGLPESDDFVTAREFLWPVYVMFGCLMSMF